MSRTVPSEGEAHGARGLDGRESGHRRVRERTQGPSAVSRGGVAGTALVTAVSVGLVFPAGALLSGRPPDLSITNGAR